MTTRRTHKRTQTSSFGTPGRVSHDASRFYDSQLYQGIEGDQQVAFTENPVPPQYLDRIFCKSSEQMTELPDCSVHLMVTSPPYNAQKEYDQDLSLKDYLNLLQQIWAETYRVLVPGGRACINVANLGRKPYLPLHSYFVEQLLGLGYLMRGEIIWNKAASSSPSTAWGSWRSPANPVLRDVHEYILIFCKQTFRRIATTNRESTIGREEFLEWTKSIWSFPAAPARRIGHPAPFPEELPHRLIQLYTFKGEVVLDPFSGSGTTCMAAKRDQRHFIGYDNNPAYVKLSENRLADL